MSNYNVIFDCGAFGAWRYGEPIKLEDYAEALRHNQGHTFFNVNLDVIPGSFGQIPTHDEVEQSARKGWNNLKTLEAMGLEVLPVFHQGESFDWLVKMVEAGYDYIGISPDNTRGLPDKIVWLDSVFTILTDDYGKPKVKTHGFAATAVELMIRYPWTSVDSASWIWAGGFGQTIVPRWKNGGFDFSGKPVVVFTSEKSTKHLSGGMHFRSYGKVVQKHILEYFDLCGYTYEDLRDSLEARSIVYAMYLIEAAKLMTDMRFENRTHNFHIFPYVKCLDHLPTIDNPRLQLFFSISMAPLYSDILNWMGVKDRLVSFWQTRNMHPDFIKFYAEYGTFPGDVGRKRWYQLGTIDAPSEPVFVQRTDKTDPVRSQQRECQYRNWKKTVMDSGERIARARRIDEAV